MWIHEIKFKETKLRQFNSRQEIPWVAELVEASSAKRLQGFERCYAIQILEAWALHVDAGQPRGNRWAGNGHERKAEGDGVVNIVAQINAAAQDTYEVRWDGVECRGFVEGDSFYPSHDWAVLERPHDKPQTFFIQNQERAIEKLVAKMVP
jgi:hypothetical protein